MSASLTAPPPPRPMGPPGAPPPRSALASLQGAPPGAPAPSAAPLPPLPPTDDANSGLMDGIQVGSPDTELAAQLKRWIESVNICDELSEEEIGEIGHRVGEEFEIDEASRAEWLESYRKWMDLALQKIEPKTYPWPGASAVVYPLMTTASVQFAARAYPGIVVNRDVVKGVVVGSDENDDKKQRADRVGGYMSWQLLEEMEEWEGDTDKLLHILPIVGSCFRKTYFDPAIRRNTSRLVTSDRVCVNYRAIGFHRAPRVTEILQFYPNEIEEKVRSGEFIDQDYVAMNTNMDNDIDAPVEFLEQHRRWDLDGDGYAEPYIVTVLKDTAKVARIVANYDMDSVTFARSQRGGELDTIRTIKEVSYFTPYEFLPNPDGGVYGIGFGHLIYPINAAINTSLNMLLDAGHLANTGGGFMGKGISLSSGTLRFAPGEYKQVNIMGSVLKDNIVPLPFQGPNQTLFELLQFLVEAGKEVAAIKDVLMGDQPSANMAATTVLALVEQGMVVFSAIYKRVHRSLKSEYRKLYRLNRLYMDEVTKFRRGDQWLEVQRTDFSEDAGVEPISDPTMVSNMQKLARANFLLQFKDDPRINGLKVLERVMDYAGVDNFKELLNENPQPDPQLQLAQAQLKLQQDTAAETLAMRKAKEIAEAQRERNRDDVLNLKDYTSAYLNLANAEKAAGSNDRDWLTHQTEFFRSEMDRLSAGLTTASNPVAGAGAANGLAAGAVPPAVQPVAPQPGNGGVPSLPASPSP